MRNLFIYSLALILSWVSCTNPVKNNNVAIAVDRNLIHCENTKFTIKIDRLENGEVRYTCWNKPKTITDTPDLVLNNGVEEKQGTAGGYHYQFTKGEWEYIIEDKWVGESFEGIGLFLKVMKNNEEVLYTEMTDIKVQENYDKLSYTKQDLEGNWWTPHFAVRNISFYNDNTFLLKEGNGHEMTGKYSLSDRNVVLEFESGGEMKLEIGGGKDQTSMHLTGEEEYFIK